MCWVTRLTLPRTSAPGSSLRSTLGRRVGGRGGGVGKRLRGVGGGVGAISARASAALQGGGPALNARHAQPSAHLIVLAAFSLMVMAFLLLLHSMGATSMRLPTSASASCGWGRAVIRRGPGGHHAAGSARAAPAACGEARRRSALGPRRRRGGGTHALPSRGLVHGAEGDEGLLPHPLAQQAAAVVAGDGDLQNVRVLVKQLKRLRTVWKQAGARRSAAAGGGAPRLWPAQGCWEPGLRTRRAGQSAGTPVGGRTCCMRRHAREASASSADSRGPCPSKVMSWGTLSTLNARTRPTGRPAASAA
jgi:hypothetical protein